MGEHGTFMDMAIEEANRGAADREQPFGALVRSGHEVVSRAHSRKVGASDPTAHAEILAVSSATRGRGERTLPDCLFYATCEPCPMCAGAILNAGIHTLVIGVRIADIIAPQSRGGGFKDYTVERFAQLTGWDVEVIAGVRKIECIEMYRRASVPLTR